VGFPERWELGEISKFYTVIFLHKKKDIQRSGSHYGVGEN